MGLWLQVRFEDFILSWKTSTDFFEFWALSFELLLPSMCKEERKQQQRLVYWSFIWNETPMKKIVTIGFSALNSIVFFPFCSLSNVFVESYILKLLLILCIYIHINDVLFLIHMAFSSLVYAEKWQVCSRVLLEVRLDMPFFCILV